MITDHLLPTKAPVLIWFRQDLRLADNSALTAAAAMGQPVLPVFILESGDGQRRWGGASRWWLHHSLASLAASLKKRGLPLVLDRGDPAQVLSRLARESGACCIHWNARHEPREVAQDLVVKGTLEKAGLTVVEHLANLLAHPTDLATGQGGPYKVFTPYWKKFLQTQVLDSPLPVPTRFVVPSAIPASQDLASWNLLPKIGWDSGLQESWKPGEGEARALWDVFRAGPMLAYGTQRDIPSRHGTSRLSPYLHWGEISSRQLWHDAQNIEGSEGFLRQLVWREFSHHLLHHFPHTQAEPLRSQFSSFPWDGDPALLASWQKGQTGFPLVDAGMRQLWHSGWMHNRVRMVVASFLVKHLLLPWQDGASWFWDTLVDASLANNTFGWQWAAGCGADAAPFFRIFNPITQGKRWDPRGNYIRRWVPELAGLPDKLIQEPWTASEAVLEHLGVKLGRDYPFPVVDHAWARQRALDSYGQMRG